MLGIDSKRMSASFALAVNGLTADGQCGFRIFACRTQNEFANKAVQNFLKLVRVVLAVDDVAVVFQVEIGLRTEFTTKVFCRICNMEELLPCLFFFAETYKLEDEPALWRCPTC